MKFLSANQWTGLFVAVIAGIMGITVYTTIHPSEPSIPKDYVLPHDDFDQKTMEQISADFNQYTVSQTPQDHEVYMITGGLGVANPRIMAWDSYGNMDFGKNGPPGTLFTFRQYGVNLNTWKQAIPIGKVTPEVLKKTKRLKFRYVPVQWIKHVTKSGEVYYKLHDPSQAPQYYFQKGKTFIWVMSFPNDVFPEGVIDHLVPIGNPVQRTG